MPTTCSITNNISIPIFYFLAVICVEKFILTFTLILYSNSTSTICVAITIHKSIICQITFVVNKLESIFTIFYTDKFYRETEIVNYNLKTIVITCTHKTRITVSTSSVVQIINTISLRRLVSVCFLHSDHRQQCAQ